MKVTLYELLGVLPTASVEVIHAAARALLRRYHPDNEKTGDAEAFRAVKAASVILENPLERKKYDASIGLGKKKKRSAVDPAAYPPAYPAAFPELKFDVGDLLGQAIAAAGRSALNKLMEDNPILREMMDIANKGTK